MTHEKARTKADTELLIALLSGENYTRLITDYNEELGGMFGVSDYLVNMVHKQCIESVEYQKAIKFEQTTPMENRWHYFEVTHGTCLDWFFLDKCREIINKDYPVTIKS